MVTVEAHPATGSPNIKIRATRNTIPRRAKKQKRIPNKEEIASGFTEKAIMPSRE
jgi:hypothetical protein